MPCASRSRFVSIPLLLAMPLSLMACSKSEPGSSDGAATDVAERPTSRVTSKKTEWSVGGLVGGKTETITSEPVPGPPVIV